MKFADVTPNLIVSDLDRSLAFYRDVLGFSVFATVPEAAPFVFAWMQRDGVNVFLNTVGSVKDEHPAREIAKTRIHTLVCNRDQHIRTGQSEIVGNRDESIRRNADADAADVIRPLPREGALDCLHPAQSRQSDE